MVCGVIKKWEDDIAENKKKEIEEEKDQKKESLIQNEIEIRGEKKEIAIEVEEDNTESAGEFDKEVGVEIEGEVEGRGFGTYWPFLCNQRECDRASDYLSAINNSHIITQLISNLKILQLAEERGLQIVDRDLIADIGNVEIPRTERRDDELYYSDDDYDDYDDDQYYSDDYSDGEYDDDDGYDEGKSHSNSHTGSDRGSDGDRNSDRGRCSENEIAGAGKRDFVQGDEVDLKGHDREKEEKGEKEKKEIKETKGDDMEEENFYSDEDEDECEYDYDDDCDRDRDRCHQIKQLRSKTRKSRRRTANNKKRRMKKKMKHAEVDNNEGRESREEAVDESREEVEGEGRTRVTFKIDSKHQVHDPLLAQSHTQIIPSEENDINAKDNCDEDSGIKSSTATPSSCSTLKSQHTAVGESKSENLNGHSAPIDLTTARTYIRDIASTDEKKKSIRVHEYYKLWRIYDLDVVY